MEAITTHISTYSHQVACYKRGTPRPPRFAVDVDKPLLVAPVEVPNELDPLLQLLLAGSFKDVCRAKLEEIHSCSCPFLKFFMYFQYLPLGYVLVMLHD